MALPDITLSLNDFRSVLGNVNDGNVVFKADNTGIEKANYGSKFLNLFRTTREAPDKPEENARIRLLLMDAIANSAERKVLSRDTLERIYAALGMPDGSSNQADMQKPLSRRELKAALDIIDQATMRNTMITKNLKALDDAGLLDKSVSKAVADACNKAPFLQLQSDKKQGLALMKSVFGDDFLGRSPKEMQRFVSDNYAVIREQVFDRLYWTNPSLKDFSEDDNLNASIPDEKDEAQLPVVDQETVKDAFKAVVEDLMQKFAANEKVTTRLMTLAGPQKDVNFSDDTAKNIWNNVLKGAEIEQAVRNIFGAPKEAVGVLGTLQLQRACDNILNALTAGLNASYAQEHYDTQLTEKDFNAKFGPLVNVLKEVSEDLKNIGEDAAGAVRAELAAEIGRLVFANDAGDIPGRLQDAVVKALDNVVKGFSSRHIVEDFVNEKFSYLADKTSVLAYFMEKISNGSEEQKTALANYQKAVIAGSAQAVRLDFELTVLNPIVEDYNNKMASEKPEMVLKMRKTRNDTFFQAELAKMPGIDTMSEDKKTEKLLDIKVKTLVAKIGSASAFALGITDSTGSWSIKTRSVKVVDPEQAQKEKYITQIDQEAVEKLEKALLDMNDKDFEFYSQYTVKGMSIADNDIAVFSMSAFGPGKNENIFQTALRDGAISIASIPKNAVPLLQKILQAQIYAALPDEENSGMGEGIGLKELLPHDEVYGSPLAKGLVERLSQRFAATGIKPVPHNFMPITPNETDKATASRLNIQDSNGIMRVHGFGTMDLTRILKLFNDVGLSLAPLEGNDMKAKIDVYEKVMCLSMLASMSGFKLEGLAEFTQRVTGKSFADVTYGDVIQALSKNKILFEGETISGGRALALPKNLTMDDPLNALKGVQKTAKEFLSGELPLSGVGLSTGETVALLEKVRELGAMPPGATKTVKIVLNGAEVELTRLPGGDLSAKCGNLPFRAAFDAHGIVRMIENAITTKPDAFDAAVVKSALPSIEAVKSGRVPLVRARELYAKTAAAKTGLLPVMFSHCTTEEMRDIALRAVDGKFTAADLPKEPPATYNSGAMIEMHDNLALTSSAEIDAKVKINVPEGKSIELRRAVPPDAPTVHNIIADLFLNKDTWEFDAGAKGDAKPGERIRKLLVEHGPELSFILKGLDANGGNDLLASLPEPVRNAAKGVLEDIKKLDLGSLANAQDVSDETRQALAAIETKVDGVANALVDDMQTKVTALFAPKAGDADGKAPWQKTFAELTGKEGIDVTTKQGAFTMKVLQNYFKNSAPVDKRAMLSAFIRNTDASSSEAKQVAELLKGAGPLLQKMLQGLPLSSFNAETQLALKDMKSRLLPIPDAAVKAQMLELVRSSNGEILSIEVTKSLGAASVGQAFLCTIKTKAHPYIGEECVVKLLRPNVDTAIQREKALIDRLIADDPAMKATFDGQYRKILEEFDLTLESENVGIGTKVYEYPGGVQTLSTMQMLDGTVPTMTAMIVKKADGQTFDAMIDKLRGEAEDILNDLRTTTEVGGKTKTVYKAQSAVDSAAARRDLMGKIASLNDRRNHILDVAKAWFDNALFGNGFFHGDLHGGNLMTAATGTTFIDFGNCSRLSTVEQNAFKMMFATIMSGDTDRMVGNFMKLLPQDAQTAFREKFPKGSDAEKELVSLLQRGDAFDMMPRLQAFLAAVQGADVPIPPAVQNFVQSYMRLNDIIVEIDRTTEDLRIAANAIYCDLPQTEPVPGEPKLFSALRKIAKAFTGDANTPYSREAVNAAAEDFARFVKSEDGKAEILELTSSEEKLFGVLEPFMQDIRKVVFNSRTQIDVRPGERKQSRMPEGISSIISSFTSLSRLRKDGKYDTKEAKDIISRIASDLSTCGKAMANGYNSQMTTDRENGKSVFVNIASKRDKSMTDICSDVIFAHQKDLEDLAGNEFGSMLFAVPFALRLGKNYDAAEAQARVRKRVGPALEKLNNKLPVAERLSAAEMTTLTRATSTFLVQTPRPDANADWGGDATKRADFISALSYNISRAVEALKLPQGQKASEAAIRHAALSCGLSDGKLVVSVTSLKQTDYDLLLGEAQKTGNRELAIALEALRGAKALYDDLVEGS